MLLAITRGAGGLARFRSRTARCTLEVTIEDGLGGWARLEHVIDFELRVFRQHCTTRPVQIYLLARALKRPMALLEAFLAQLGALHVCAIANSIHTASSFV